MSKIKAILTKLKNMSPAAKASFWFVVSNVVLKGISFITTPIFTRLLDATDYGISSVFITWESVISIFATLILLLFIYFIYSFIVDRTTLANEDKWDGVSIATSFSSGNGTIDNPYLISNGSEFIYFKNLIEGNDANLYKDKYYKLSNDIDFDNHSFLP